LNPVSATFGVAVCFYYLASSSRVVEQLGVPSASPVLPQAIAVGSSAVTVNAIGTNLAKNEVIVWNDRKPAISKRDANSASGAIQNCSFGGLRSLWADDANIGSCSPIESGAQGKAGHSTFIDSVLEPVSGGNS
jgi:hypothetical protein